MTHPAGGSGTGPAGPSGTSPRLEHDADVRAVDAYTSLVDTFVAHQLRHGFTPDQLDRNGRVLVAATPRES